MNRPHRSLTPWIACVGFLSVAPAMADAPAAPRASLARLWVRADPSREPPVDVLTALVLLDPGADEADVEIQAVDDTPPPDAEGEGTPRRPIRFVQGAGAAYRAADGRFRLTAKASRPGGDALVTVVVPIPRPALRLDAGVERIRYTATGRIGGEAVFFASSRPVMVASPQPAPPQDASRPPAQAGPQFVPAPAVYGSPFGATKERTIHFATNRDVRGSTGTPSARFGDQVDDGLRYGSCPVNVPTEEREPGSLPMPRRGAAGDPAREFFILEDSVRLLDDDEFRGLLRGPDAARDVLVYVHGFNTSFNFAVVRMAQVVEDLDFAGMPVVFSWPAREVAIPMAGDYARDEANADRSYGALARVLRTLADEQEARPAGRRGKIHVVAHSLGNRVTMRALSILDTLLPAGSRPMGQVVLAAPDVSVEEFSRLQPTIERRSERVSLYFNPNDRALWASFAKHGRERRAGNSAQFLRGLDNIDAARADTSLLGHGYWSDARAVLLDMRLLITKGWEPARRVPDVLRAFTRPQPYWAFPAERRFGPILSPW